MTMNNVDNIFDYTPPELKLGTLVRIAQDIAPQSTTLLRVGIVGSYARGDNTEYSDVDLVFQTSTGDLDEACDIGMRIKRILYDQFMKKADIINYDTILYKSQNDDPTGGYAQMLKDIKLLWERCEQ